MEGVSDGILCHIDKKCDFEQLWVGISILR